MRRIGHIDLDAFFATCEELRNPHLEERPIVICVYTRDGSSGAVSTCNYKARELGIDSAMPLKKAQSRATSDTVFLAADHGYYSKISGKIISILHTHSRQVQKYSIDEAFFHIEKNPLKTAKKIKADIEAAGLSSSIGIGPNRFVAKMASEQDKPDGLRMVKEDEVKDFLTDKPVGDIHGVGEKTEQKLLDLGIETCLDIRQANTSRLVEEIGKSKASTVTARAYGKGSRDLGSDEKKQMSKIITMQRNSSNLGYISKELSRACQQLIERLESENKAFSNVGIVAVDTELETYTRSRAVKTSRPGKKLYREAESLLNRLISEEDPTLRRVGVRVSDLIDTERQTMLSAF